MVRKEVSKTPSNTANNAFFAVISQMILTLSPLITTPFVSRQLGAANLGVFAHTLVMVQYFQMFAMLGVVNYGTRTIAENRYDPRDLSAHFWEIYGLQILNTIVFLSAYLLYLLFLPSQDRIIPLIQIIWLVSAFFDINWFFYGIEQIKITAWKDLAVKTLTIVCILLFVRKNHNPLLIYTIIMSGSNLLGLIALFPILREFIIWVKPSLQNILRHLKPNLILFVPIVAASVYHSMDKTMLGWMTSYEELGYYYNADKIINVPLQVINALCTAFLPKASELLNSDKKHEAAAFLKTSFEIAILLACALAFGIGGCAKDFVPVFFGAGYEPCIQLIYLFVPVLIIKTVSAFIRMEFLVPMHYEKVYIASTVTGAVVNLVFNIILIPFFGASGAVMGTLLAELSVMTIQIKGAENGLPHRHMLLSTICYLVIAAVMFLAMKGISIISHSVLIRVVLEVIAGASVYIASCLAYWKYISHNSEILKMMTGIFKKEKNLS